MTKPQLKGTIWHALVRAEILIAHNPKVAGSNPAPATNETAGQAPLLGVGPSAFPADFYRVFYRTPVEDPPPAVLKGKHARCLENHDLGVCGPSVTVGSDPPG